MIANNAGDVASRRMKVARKDPVRYPEAGKKREMRKTTYLGRLANFLPDHFPLVVLIVFDRLQQSGALLSSVSKSHFFFLSRVCEADEIADLVFRKFGVVHVLLVERANCVSMSFFIINEQYSEPKA